jgi:hypothetical protein
MDIKTAQNILLAEQQEKDDRFNENVKYIVTRLIDIIDNGNVDVTYETERGDLHITLKNKHYRGLHFFQPKVVVTVIHQHIVDNICRYKYEPFFTEVFTPKYELEIAKFIVYLYKKLKLNYVSHIP